MFYNKWSICLNPEEIVLNVNVLLKIGKLQKKIISHFVGNIETQVVLLVLI